MLAQGLHTLMVSRLHRTPYMEGWNMKQIECTVCGYQPKWGDIMKTKTFVADEKVLIRMQCVECKEDSVGPFTINIDDLQ